VSTRGTTKALAIFAAVSVTLALGPTALADHHDGTSIPSKHQVDAAQRHAANARMSVKDIEGQLAAAAQRLNALDVAAEQAAEAYNGARIAWHSAEAAAVAARHRVVLAERNAATSRRQLAGYLVTADNSGNDLSSFSLALTADGPHRLLRDMSNADASAQTLDARLQSWRATSSIVKVYRAAAESALVAASAAKQRAHQARAAAAAAVAAQRVAVVTIGAQRRTLLAELAKAQHVSVALAKQRQHGLELRREARRRERQRELLLAQQRREARQQRREARAQHREQQQQPGGGGTTPPPAPAPTPTPPTPSPTPPPAAPGNAQAAVNFAYAQLGDPYVWAAAGPNAWDCSGLTMGAWAAAGVALPHYSVAQYYATTPVSYSQLQPGDLIFWASDPSNPNTIFHVAIYIGNGKMIQAPHTGEYVEISDVFSWESPDFFTRP
jgi:cell wall-associated NlpC family hydrolase